MLEIEFIRQLCREIVEEKDPAKAQARIAELKKLLAMESDEMHLRLRYATKLLDETTSTDFGSNSAA